MDELTKSEIEEYLNDLPVSVLGIIQDKTWKKRVSEVSAKYSLSEEQDTILRNLVLFVVIGAEEPETFKDSVKKELAISDLLAEQIVGEIDERVFQYIFNQISGQTSEEKTPEANEGDLDELRTMTGDIKAFKEGDIKEKTENKVIFAPTLPEKSKQQEIKTEPIKEEKKGEDKFQMVGNNFVPPNLPGVEVEEQKKSFLDMGTTQNNTPKPQETGQKPMIGVPRYTASPEALEKESEPEQQKPTFGSITESKLNSAVSSQKETQKTEVPNKYSIDPYREPLE